MKKKFSAKFLSLAVAICMLLTLFPMSAFAVGKTAVPVIGGNPGGSSFTFSIHDGTAKDAAGIITRSKTTAFANDIITITVLPQNGYSLDTLTIKTASGAEIATTQDASDSYTFKMPQASVTAIATFMKIGGVWEYNFDDVNVGDWFYDSVMYAAHKGIMLGTSPELFNPNSATTRAMFWTSMARDAGVDLSVGANWYEAAAQWAISEGISDGKDPEATITREQAITMLYRQNGSPVIDDFSCLEQYSDMISISEWAGPAMAWAVENGVIDGYGGVLLPAGIATRAETAALFVRTLNP